jgi:formate--tetrahydrofolate ligase
VNERELRNMVTGLGSRFDGRPRETGFSISAASEVMAILALTTGLRDMRARFGRILVGYDGDGRPVTAEDLRAAGAMTVLMKEAVKPNLFQTLENTPALVHAGPFANIAHGNSSVLADLVGVRAADYLITEAGFGADIGAEKFFNIKCRASGLAPHAAVLVVSVRAMKLHTGRYRVRPGRPLPDEMRRENPDDVREGGANLVRQIEGIRKHGVRPVVCVNRFPGDHDSEVEAVFDLAAASGARCAEANHWAEGGAGAVDLARAVIEAADEPCTFRYLYDVDRPIKDKIETIAREIYGAGDVTYEMKALKQIDAYEEKGFGGLPVCMAKTHLSLTDDPTRKGAPTGFTLPIREVRASVGAGFIYPLVGTMRTMPGLPSRPAAENVDIDPETGRVTGLS